MTDKKRIAIYTQDAKLGNEVKGATRYVYLATLLHEQGYDVDFITSGFQHWEKRQRDVEHFDAGTDAYTIRFIEEPFYPKNMCPQRIWAHHVVAKRVSEYFDEHHDYDLIYCQIPPNDVAREIGKAAQKFNIPFVVDVNDLWPEAFRVALDVPVLSDILFSPFYRQAKAVYQMADAVVGTSDEYRERGLRDARSGIPSETVYVGNQLCEFDAGVAANASQIDKPAGDIWVSYAGTLSACYDLETLVNAMALVQKSHPEAKLHILGDGSERENLKAAAQSCGASVTFHGYLPYDQMAAWLSKSDITINSLVEKAAQSIVTKIGDYLAAGKPMVNTSCSKEFRAKVEADGFGVNVKPGDAEGMARVLADLIEDSSRRAQMGEKARAIAEEQFDRPHSYLKTVRLIEGLIG
mgnify:FL=1